METQTKLKEFRPVAQEPLRIEDVYPIGISSSFETMEELHKFVANQSQMRIERRKAIYAEVGIDKP